MDQDSVTILADTQENKIKVILIGDQSVGKSSLMEHMLNIESKFNDKSCQSVDFFISRVLMPEGGAQKIYVWITSGEIKQMAFLIQCHIYVIAFSLNSKVSMENAINTWFSCCAKNAKQSTTMYYFLGTMSDMDRNVGTYQDIIGLINEKAKELKLDFSTLRPLMINSYQSRSVRGSMIVKDDEMTTYANKMLPANVYYSECSAKEGLGMPRSNGIFTKLIQLAIANQPVKASKPAPNLGISSLEQTKSDSNHIELASQAELKQLEKPCCTLF